VFLGKCYKSAIKARSRSAVKNIRMFHNTRRIYYYARSTDLNGERNKTKCTTDESTPRTNDRRYVVSRFRTRLWPYRCIRSVGRNLCTLLRTRNKRTTTDRPWTAQCDIVANKMILTARTRFADNHQ
jgi:hypothetical protein